MSSSNLIQFQQIKEPADLSFVFPLSRYNQQIFGIKNNFITYNFDLNYNILKFYENKIGVDIGIGYFSTLNSIYKNANWSFRGYNLNLGIKYYYNDNNLIKNNNPQDKKQIFINDTLLINDTLKIKEITENETLNSTFKVNFVKSDTTYNIKKTDDYILKIITIKNTFNKIEYESTKSQNINLKNLIIPNLELFYSYNDNLTKSYYNKINKQITKYNYLNIADNDLNEFINNFSNNKETTNRSFILKNKILESNISISDTVVTIAFPDILFKLDIFSEEAITSCKVIVNALNGDIDYKDTLNYEQYIDNKIDINYKFNLNKFKFANSNNKTTIGNQITTNYIFGDFRFSYVIIIEDNSGNLDNTLNGSILFETIYYKSNKINEKNILLIEVDNKLNKVNLNKENYRFFEENFKEIYINISKFQKYKVYELID